MNKTVLLRELNPHKSLLYRLAITEAIIAVAIVLFALTTSWILNSIFADSLTQEKAVPLLGVLLFVVLLRPILHYPRRCLADKISLTVQESVRKRMHKALLQSSIHSVSTKSSGQLTALFMEAVDGLDSFFTICLPSMIELVILTPVLLVTIFVADFYSAVIFLVTLPIAPFILYLLGKLTKERSQRQWQELLRLDSRFAELLRGLPMLKLFNRSSAQAEIVRMDGERFSRASLNVLELAFVSAFVLELITTLSIAIIAVSIGFRLLYGDIDFLTAFFILLAAPEFYQPLRQSGTAFHAGMEAMTAARNLEDFMYNDYINTADVKKSPHAEISLAPFPPRVRMCNISCHYPQRYAKALDNLSFDAPAACITALAGTSGSGKSTVFSLLLGQLTPSQGYIELNGMRLNFLDAQTRKQLISYVPQEPYLFADTLRNNITLGRADLSDEKLCQCLHAASLDNLLKTLPHGLNSKLGDGAALLSTGQRRRLGLARALLSSAPLLLLDEITAGLDENTEREVLTTICRLKGTHTILLASHRPTTLAIADYIITLDAGREMH